MKNIISKGKYEKWIRRMTHNCHKVSGFVSEDVTCLYVGLDKSFAYRVQRGFILSVNNGVLRIYNSRTGSYGWSKKSKKDKWDSRIALAIAWARYCKNEIPMCEERLTKDQIKGFKVGDIIYDTIAGMKMKFVGIDPMNGENIIVWVIQDENRASLESIYPEDGRYSSQCQSLFTK